MLQQTFLDGAEPLFSQKKILPGIQFLSIITNLLQGQTDNRLKKTKTTLKYVHTDLSLNTTIRREQPNTLLNLPTEETRTDWPGGSVSLFHISSSSPLSLSLSLFYFCFCETTAWSYYWKEEQRRSHRTEVDKKDIYVNPNSEFETMWYCWYLKKLPYPGH